MWRVSGRGGTLISSVLNRIAFEQSRELEFFDEKELNLQIGTARGSWALAILKELVDNALDACEKADIAPCIEIEVTENTLVLSDNGPGIPARVIESALDYTKRISTNAAYVAPTRGQLGNALKCVWAAPFVIDGQHGRVEVEANGQRHAIDVRLDRIRQKPVISHTLEASTVKNGTRYTLTWKNLACFLSLGEMPDFYRAFRLVKHYASLNPHATFILNGTRYEATGNLDKWRPQDPTSPHWYSLDKLSQFMAYQIGHDPARSLRDVVSEFRGLSGTGKRKQVLEQSDLAGKTVGDLEQEGDIDRASVQRLLLAMREYSRPVKPDDLGRVGEESFRAWLEDMPVREESIQYKYLKAEIGGLPYGVEAGFAIYDHDGSRNIYTGVNFTPMLESPFSSLETYLSVNRVDYAKPCLVWVHVVCPRIAFTDRGKSRAILPSGVPLAKAIEAVTVKWRKYMRQADRDNKLRQSAIDAALKAERATKLSDKAAAWQVMEQAYMDASSKGEFPANARQIMYKARGPILELTGKAKLSDTYFTQTLLPDFINENPELTEAWDVVYDARGNLIEPHTGKKIPLGTLAVRGYIDGWQRPHIPTGIPWIDGGIVTTHGPLGRYGFALFIEKEGFWPLLEKARIAQKWDIAIMSTKGMSTTSARYLVDRLAQDGTTILVAHDFDKSGIDILTKLSTDTRRYRFKVTPKVIDIGIRMEDIEAMQLESEHVTYRGKKDPRILLRQQGATEAEANMLVSGGRPKDWHGRRVELNAMDSRQFIDWLEAKFKQYGVKKVVPDLDTLKRAYQRAAYIKQVNDAIAKVKAEEVAIPDDLEQQVKDGITEDDELPWDEVIKRIAQAA